MLSKAQGTPIRSVMTNQLNQLLCGIFALWTIVRLAPLPDSNEVAFAIMDGIFIVTTIIVFLIRPFANPKAYAISLIFTIYFLIDLFVLYVFGQNNGHFTSGLFKDFLYSDKYFVYVILLGVFVSSQVFEEKTIRFLLITFITGCIIKYSYSIVLGIDDRPKLLLENNYELMMLLTLFVLNIAIDRWNKRRTPHYMVILVVFIVGLSGSRSAAIALLPIITLLYAKPTAGHFLAFLILAPVATALIVMLFEARIGASGRIDRVAFFDVFIYELQSFKIWNYIIGVKPLSPLSPSSCHQLSYYQTLFSAQENGQCYATVLHSYFLRSLHDHGIVGSVVPFFAIFYFLGGGKFSRGERWTLLSIGFLCGFSVAGIGANFVAFPLALAAGLRRPATLSIEDEGIGLADETVDIGEGARRAERILPQSRFTTSIANAGTDFPETSGSRRPGYDNDFGR